MRVIALDGPAGAGKSTIARLVAREVGMPFLDTGAMYRGVAYAAIRDGGDVSDPQVMGQIARTVSLHLDGEVLLVDGDDVSIDIRTDTVNSVVSVIATHTPVRDEMRRRQREWIVAHNGGVVEGRDIGTVVFPDAMLKVFLTASPDVRAQRRVGQSGGDVSEVAASIAERDRIDSTRADSPLRPADDAVVIDTSDLSIAQVVERIGVLFRERDEVRDSVG